MWKSWLAKEELAKFEKSSHLFVVEELLLIAFLAFVYHLKQKC